MSYSFKDIENKWRSYWKENDINRTDLYSNKDKYYNLFMFPYPSGDRLHVGHWFCYGPPDTHVRFMKMRGYEVLQPVGYDSFGLPTENYSIKNNITPFKATEDNINIFTRQFQDIGGMYDWSHYLATSEANYYKWTQWLFLVLYEKGLAYKEKTLNNWCPQCQTVVANAEVMSDGTHERCDTPVEKKFMDNWFFKITDYADRLLKDLDKVNYPNKTKVMQKNWIGRSEGAKIKFKILDSEYEFEVFTTRPDTLYGVSYCTLAPEHNLVEKITVDSRKKAVTDYLASIKTLTDIERQSTERDKTGVFTGAYAINPINGEKVPIWISDYVLVSYGTGAVMAVPAHDQRDFEFAKKFQLPIKIVISSQKLATEEGLQEAYTDKGVLVNSQKFSGYSSEDAAKGIVEVLESEGNGHVSVNYRLRDWSISRQRFWGCPIPIIYCDECGTVPVPLEDLPVTLPNEPNIDFKPAGKAPLELSESFINCRCPKCGKMARREAETMDTFVCSSWYFLRFVNPELNEHAFQKKEINKWLPVDTYVGGTEHVTGHMLYARFITKVLCDLGYIDVDEPFNRVIHQGIITNNGSKMSKSKGNAISPDAYIEKYGTDIFRMHIMFMANFEEAGDWSDESINGVDRFAQRVWRLVAENSFDNTGNQKIDQKLNYTLHYTIKAVTKDLENYSFNTAISRLMELVNEIYAYKKDVKRYNGDFINFIIPKLIVLYAPFAPHMAEELWQKLGNSDSVFKQNWPLFDEKALICDTQNITVMINGKVKDNFQVGSNISDQEIETLVLKRDKVVSYMAERKLLKCILINGKKGTMINIVAK